MKLTFSKLTILYISIIILALVHIIFIQEMPPMQLRIIVSAVFFIISIFSSTLRIPIIILLIIYPSLSLVNGGYTTLEPLFFLSIILIGITISQQKYKSSKSNRILILFALASFISNLLGYLHEFNTTYIIIIIILINLNSNFENSAIKSYVFISLLFSILFIVSYFNIFSLNINFNDVDDIRINFKDPNYYSSAIGICNLILLSSIIYKKESTLNNTLKIFFLIITYILIILSASRGTAISLLISTIVLLFNSKTVNKSWVVFIFIILTMYLVYINGIFDDLVTRSKSINFLEDTRFEIWKITFLKFLSSDIKTLFLGGGEKFAIEVLGNINNIKWSPHNSYLEILYNFGIIGLGLFLYFFYHLYKSSDKIGKVIILYLMLSSISICPFSQYLSPFWIILPFIKNINEYFKNN